MRINNVLNRAEDVIGNAMQLSHISYISNSIVYTRSKSEINFEKIEQIQANLLTNGMYAEVKDYGSEYVLRILAEFPAIKKENPVINIILLFFTVITTAMAGAQNIWIDPFSGWSALLSGLTYSFSVLTILFFHEMGHYLYSLKHRIYATLPYFLPVYFPGFMFGTLGAFIKMKSPIPNKKALFDVGIAGPFAGFVVSIFFLVYGFSILPDEQGLIAYVETMHPWSPNGEGAFTLGNSLLFSFLRNIMGADYLPMWEIYHFPFIFAGWIGLFVTALNLMPIGQLDGGHISYAMFGEKARIIAILAFVALAALNFYSINWLLWTILIFFLIRLKHPPTMDESMKIDKRRKILGWISYIIFITCFSPMPFYLN